jgi:hypothetical protein
MSNTTFGYTKVGKFVPVKAYGGIGCIDPRFHDLGTSWGPGDHWGASRPPPINPQGKRHRPLAGDSVDPTDGPHDVTLPALELRPSVGNGCTE